MRPKKLRVAVDAPRGLAREFDSLPATAPTVAQRILAVAFLSSGAALVTYIVAGISLAAGLALAAALLMAAWLWTWRAAGSLVRPVLLRVTVVGLVAGVAATGAYDASKFALSHYDASVYNPFAVLPIFGAAIVGSAAPATAQNLAGWAYHVLNGATFGAAFALLVPRRGIVTGILWGLFLEAFQLALFPGWLGITAYTEFAQVSALSHVAYGTSLGMACRWALRGG